MSIPTANCLAWNCSTSSVPFSCTFTNIHYDIDNDTVTSLWHPDPTNTTIVTFVKSLIPQIPSLLFDVFPNVQHLEMQYCGLRFLLPDTFVNGTHLVHLQLSRNNLTDLKYGSLRGLGNLTHLELAHNQIQKINDRVFGDLVQLKILDLSHNVIEELGETTFERLTSLETLLLDFNRIVRVDKSWFKDTRKILFISLTHNHINFVHDGAFADGLDELFQVRLSGNRLAKIDMRNIDAENLDIDNNAIRSLYVGRQARKVLRLDAQSNMISKLRCDHNPKLVGLILTNNSLTDLSCIAKMRRLEMLFLGANKIRQLERSTFVNLINLVTLSLENNEIEFLEPGLFEQQLGLRTLTLSNNKLRQFDGNIFASTNAIDTIHINANHLTTITYEGIKQALPHLSIVDVSENEWQCSYLANMLHVFEQYGIKCLKTTDSHIDEVNVKGIACVPDQKSDEDMRYDLLYEKITKLELEIINSQLNHANVMRRLDEMSKKILLIEGRQQTNHVEYLIRE
ncbi:leucine-rich repeat-containing protein 15-like [Culicoides brevitarsis]|uniref:leucine-rich repeat-containing protein 15-like n=1 Tax=Culicoides brevitarsis TaxID=469753 RepID=UPI00307C04B4